VDQSRQAETQLACSGVRSRNTEPAHDAGKRIGVSLQVLAEITAKYLVTAVPVERAGKWDVEYVPVVLDETTLRSLHMAKRREDGGLVWRLPKILSKHNLTWPQRQEIRLRVQRGERADNLAGMFKCDVEVINQLTAG
jgi:hypothetical protein